MFKALTSLALIALLVLPASVLAATAEETLRDTMDDILQVLKEPAQKGTQAYQEERSKLEQIINDIFDFQELSARAVGLHWKRFSDEQKQEFAKAFADLLGQKYLDRIQSYKNERIVFGEMRTSARGNVEIQTRVVQDDKEIPIAYRMTETAQGWRVYDVIVEGVSLVKNYRTQFMEIMVNGSPEDLIQAVKKKSSSTSSSGTPWQAPGALQGGKAVCMLYLSVR